MQVLLRYGNVEFDAHVEADRHIEAKRPHIPQRHSVPSELVRTAVDAPNGFPPLRQALTPDDHVAIVVDSNLPDLEALLTPLAESVCSAGVAPGRITIVI